ncbi:MAG TPA: crosslink repair DNA glycosylase YcaQ family protein, partial [Jiangellaceae bacterium]|nr:crosslink repair DNA glycosylase YcaQ family protein [Jiangellaceae bacterium]
MSGDLLTNRVLNRATLARQLLLARSTLSPLEAVEHLVGLQAQNPLDPYLGLWSRLDGFDPHELGRLVEDRSLVRIPVMRSTIHLVTAD